MSQPTKDKGGHFLLLIGPKNTNVVEDVVIPLCFSSPKSIKFVLSALLPFRKYIVFSTLPDIKKMPICTSESLGFVEFGSTVIEEKAKRYRQIRGQGGHLVFFPIGLNNTI